MKAYFVSVQWFERSANSWSGLSRRTKDYKQVWAEDALHAKEKVLKDFPNSKFIYPSISCLWPLYPQPKRNSHS